MHSSCIFDQYSDIKMSCSGYCMRKLKFQSLTESIFLRPKVQFVASLYAASEQKHYVIRCVVPYKAKSFILRALTATFRYFINTIQDFFTFDISFISRKHKYLEEGGICFPLGQFLLLKKGVSHRVDITESASAQFPTWIINFGPYGQLRPVREKSSFMNYILGSINILRHHIFGIFGPPLPPYKC